MGYFFEHPIINGVVPIENMDIIDQLKGMKLSVGEELNLKDTPLVYVKSIEDGMVVLSKDKVRI